MAYLLLLNARESCPSECKIKGRCLWDKYTYELTHGTPHKGALFPPSYITSNQPHCFTRLMFESFANVHKL
jgi:hypothetical protein